MDYIKNTLIVILVLLFGYNMYLSNIIYVNKERINEKSKSLSGCRNTLNYYKWVFKNMPKKDEYLQGEDSSPTDNGWEHNATFSIPINLGGLKSRPP